MIGKIGGCALLVLVLLLPKPLLAQEENEEIFAAIQSGNLALVEALLAAGADAHKTTMDSPR